MREYDSAAHGTAVSLTPLWHAQWSHWHCCPNMTPLWLWKYVYKKTYIGKFTYTISTTFRQKIWRLTEDRFHSRFSPRIRSHIKKGFNPCIRGLGGVVWWKKPEVENLVSWSLYSKQLDFSINFRQCPMGKTNKKSLRIKETTQM
jgi:hypothetical protein